MSDINIFIGIGRIVKDPNFKELANSKLLEITLAINKTYRHNGEKREETCFIDCQLWGSRGEKLRQYLYKGQQVGIKGELRQNTWKNQEGKTQYKHLINISEIQMLSKKEGGSAGEQDSPHMPF